MNHDYKQSPDNNAVADHAVANASDEQTPYKPQLRQFRVFVWLTLPDFKEEQEWFWTEIVPDLQSHCLQYGAEIMLLDPHKKITANPAYDPNVFDLLLKELDECRKFSQGLYFVCFIGSESNETPLPREIPSVVYNKVCSVAKEAGKDPTLLQKFYVPKDEAGASTAYELRIPTAKPIDEKEASALCELLRCGCQETQGRANHNKVADDRLMCSTECFVQRAQQVEKDLQLSTLFILRKQEVAGRPTENVIGANSLNDDCEPAWLRKYGARAISKENLEVFNTTAAEPEDVAYQRSKERERYYQRFCRRISARLKHKIDASFTDSVSDKQMPTWTSVQTVFNEAELHLRYATAHRPHEFLDEGRFLDRVKTACQNGLKCRRPCLMVQGAEGAGKSALVCELSQRLLQWFNPKSYLIVRFVGLTPQSTQLHELFRSICLEICMKFGLTTLQNEFINYCSNEKMLAWFARCCATVSEKVKEPLLILIDDVHVLKEGLVLTGDRMHAWLPLTCDAGVILVLTIGELAEPAQTALQQSTEQKYLLKMPTLTADQAYAIFEQSLTADQQRLRIPTLPSKQTLVKTFEKCPTPLFAYFLANSQFAWDSPDVVSPPDGSDPLRAVLVSTVEQAEAQFGSLLCMYLFSFIECSHLGLTLHELFQLITETAEDSANLEEDLCSQIENFSSLQWIKMKSLLRVVIEERVCDARTVMTWSHPFIGTVVRHRYLSSSTLLKRYHGRLVSLYLNRGVASAGENDMEVKSMTVNVPTANASGGANRYNAFYIIPQVRNLWYHLLHTGSIENLESVGFCKFDYLYKTVFTTGIFHMRTMIEGALQQVLNHNLHVLYTMVLRPSFKFLYQDPNLLAAEVILRLSYDRRRNTDVLNKLLDQAMLWVDTCCSFPLIVPLTSWIRPSVCALVTRFRVKDWRFVAGKDAIVIEPTINYQHLLVSGQANDGLIWMYHIASHRLIRSFVGHSEQVIFLKTSANGRYFVSGSCTGVVKVWDVYQDNCVVTFQAHSPRMCCALLSYGDQHLFTGYVDGTIYMSSVQTGQQKATFRHHMGPVTALALTSEDDYLLSGSADFTVVICSVETGAVVSKLLGLMAPVKSIMLTSNDMFALISCEDETLKVFSVCMSCHVKELQGHGGKICCLAIAHDDCQAFAGSSDGKIYCYDLHSGMLLATQLCDTSAVSSLKIASDGHFLFCGSSNLIHVLSVETKVNRTAMSIEENCVSVISISSDNKYYANGNYAGEVFLWDVETNENIWVAHCEKSRCKINCLQFDTDSFILISGSSDCLVRVWSMANGTVMKTFEEHKYPIINVQIFADRSKIASSDSSGFLLIWTLEEDDDYDYEYKFFNEVGTIIKAVGNHDILVTVGEHEREVTVLNIVETEEMLIPRFRLNHSDRITCLRLCTDATLAVTGSKDKALKIWQLTDGKLKQVLTGHQNPITSCEVDCEWTTLVSCSKFEVIVWNLNAGNVISYFNEHQDMVSSITLNVDGRIALSSDVSGWIYAWSTKSGKKLASFNSHMPIVRVLSTSHGHRILLLLDSCPIIACLCLHNAPALDDFEIAVINEHQPVRGSMASCDGNVKPTESEPLDTRHTRNKTGDTGRREYSSIRTTNLESRPTIFSRLEKVKHSQAVSLESINLQSTGRRLRSSNTEDKKNLAGMTRVCSIL